MAQFNYNHKKASTSGSNPHDATIAQAIAPQETRQVQIQQHTKRHKSDNDTLAKNLHETEETVRARIKRKGRAWTAGLIAVPASLAVIVTGVVAGNVTTHGIDADKQVAAAQASAAAIEADRTQINVETGGFSVFCGDATGTTGGRATETVVPELDPATITGLKALGVDLKVTDGRSTLTIPAEQCTPAAMAAIAEIVAGANSPKA